jgi:hypothetical protein
MSRIAHFVLASALLCHLAAPLSAQTNPLDDETFRTLLVERLARAFREAVFLEEGRQRTYSAGRNVTLATLRNSREYSVCIDQLNYGSEGLILKDPRLTTVHRSQWKAGQASCSEFLSHFRDRQYALTDFEQQQRLREKAGLPVPEVATSVPRETADQALSEAVFAWELPALEPPAADQSKTQPRTIEEVRQEVRRVAAKHRGTDCGPGEALIPYFSDDDPYLYVWLKLGERCPEGVIHIIPDLEGRLTLGKLYLSEFDNAAVRRSIEKVLFERVALD